jgi:hypothetical protein
MAGFEPTTLDPQYRSNPNSSIALAAVASMMGITSRRRTVPSSCSARSRLHSRTPACGFSCRARSRSATYRCCISIGNGARRGTACASGGCSVRHGSTACTIFAAIYKTAFGNTYTQGICKEQISECSLDVATAMTTRLGSSSRTRHRRRNVSKRICYMISLPVTANFRPRTSHFRLDALNRDGRLHARTATSSRFVTWIVSVHADTFRNESAQASGRHSPPLSTLPPLAPRRPLAHPRHRLHAEDALPPAWREEKTSAPKQL